MKILDSVDLNDPSVEVYDHIYHRGFNSAAGVEIIRAGVGDGCHYEEVSATDPHHSEALAMYASQVKHEFPNVKFLKDNLAQTWTWLYLAMDDCPYTLGTIGYTGIYGGDNKDKYRFKSPFVWNRIYTDGDSNSYMASSEKLETIMKRIRKCLRPFYPHELFYRQRRIVTNEKDNAGDKFEDVMREKGKKVIDALLAGGLGNAKYHWIPQFIKMVENPELNEDGTLYLPFDGLELALRNFKIELGEQAHIENNHDYIQVWLNNGRYALTALLHDGKGALQQLVTFKTGSIEEMPEEVSTKIATLDFMGKEGESKNYGESNWALDVGFMAIKSELYYVAC